MKNRLIIAGAILAVVAFAVTTFFVTKKRKTDADAKEAQRQKDDEKYRVLRNMKNAQNSEENQQDTEAEVSEDIDAEVTDDIEPSPEEPTVGESAAEAEIAPDEKQESKESTAPEEATVDEDKDAESVAEEPPSVENNTDGVI